MKTLRAIAAVVGIAIRADPRRSAADAALTLLNALAVATLPYWLKLLTDAALAGDVDRALLVAGAAAAAFTVAVFAGWIEAEIGHTLQERANLVFDERMARRSLGLPGIEHHERPDVADQLALLRADRRLLTRSVQALVGAANLAIRAAATVVLLTAVHPALLALPVFGLALLATGRKAEQLRREAQEATAEPGRTADHLFDLATTAGPGKELRIFRLEQEFLARHQRIWRERDVVQARAAVRGALFNTLGWLIFGIGYGAVIVFVVDRAVGGGATAGDVLMTLGLATQINGYVQGAAGLHGWLTQVLTAVRRYLWLMDYGEATRPASAEPLIAPERFERGIAFDRVSYRYPGTDVPALADVTLHFPAGATVAIVGENGAGKTTLAKLLCRFYEPTEGRILVDEVDLRGIDVERWRERLTAGFQDFVRFELVARQAVGVGDLPRIDDEMAVLGALKRAGATDLPAVLPRGLTTQLGPAWEGGVDLSGGQWQKVALGRAMMRERPLLLILDEPTASLDAETEHALFARHAEAARQTAAETGGITLLISHRFSTVEMADLIVVLAGGRVVETGSHRQLIARRSLYAELYDLHARAYRERTA